MQTYVLKLFLIARTPQRMQSIIFQVKYMAQSSLFQPCNHTPIVLFIFLMNSRDSFFRSHQLLYMQVGVYKQRQ